MISQILLKSHGIKKTFFGGFVNCYRKV